MSRPLSKMKNYLNGFNYLNAALSSSDRPRESSITESFKNLNQHAYMSLNQLRNEMKVQVSKKVFSPTDNKTVLIYQGIKLKVDTINTDQVIVISSGIKRKNTKLRASFRPVTKSNGVH